MVLENGGSSWGDSCLADRHCGGCYSANLAWRKWEEQVCIRKLNTLIFNFLILATDETCRPKPSKAQIIWWFIWLITTA